MIHLIDCSEFGGVPGFVLLRDAGAVGCIPRLSAGPRRVDKLIDRQLDGCANAGLRVPAAYHYLYSWESGAAQAEFVLEHMLRRELRAVVLNVEPVLAGPPRPSDAPAAARETAHAYLRRWLDLTGQRAPVYGPLAYLHQLDLDRDLVGALWGAQVGNHGQPFLGKPMLARPWNGAIALHQFQHNAPGGLPGTVVDWSCTDLTIEQLEAAFAGGPRAALPSVWGTVSALADGVAGQRGPEDFDDTMPGG